MLKKTDQPVVFVSQIGQLKHAETLLTSLDIQHATAVILFSQQNTKMPIQVMAAVNHSFFSKAVKLEIHPYSNQLSPTAVRFNRRAYARTLDKIQPSSVFVCSYERHYALLCSEAEKRGIPINLFEEGAGSFKGIVPGYVSFAPPTLRSSINQIYSRLWKDTLFVNRIVLPALRVGRYVGRIFTLPYLTVKELVNAPYFNRGHLAKTEPEFVQGWKRFKKVYSSNPAIMSQIFEAEEFVELPTSFALPDEMARAAEIIEKYSIDSRTAIFTSQRYVVPKRKMIDGVVSCLKRVGARTGYRILIKLHPKEVDEIGPEYENAIRRAGYPDIQLISDGHVPAEYLAVHSDCPAVIGISSSTLIYAPRAKPSLRSITIGHELLEEFERNSVDSVGVRLIAENIRILDHVPYVEKFSSRDKKQGSADGSMQTASY